MGPKATITATSNRIARNKLVLAGAVAALAGNSAYALAQLGVLVVLARTVSRTDVGHYALALALTAPVQLGLGLRLRTTRAIDLTRTPARTYLRLSVLLAAISLGCCVLVGLVATSRPDVRLVIGLVGATKAIESVLDVCYGEYQRHDRVGAIAASQVARALLTVAAAVVGVRLNGLAGALVCMLGVWTLQLVLVEWQRVHRLQHLQPSASARYTDSQDHSPPLFGSLDLIRQSWPLGLAATVSSLSVSLPRFTVAGLLDASALGLFAVLSYPTTVISLFANSVGQGVVRRMTIAAEDRDLRALRSTFLVTVGGTSVLCAAGVLLVMIAGEHGVRALVGEAYSGQQSLLVLLMIVAGLSGLATNGYYLLVSTRRFMLQPIVVGFATVMTVPLLLLGTRWWGLEGAAYAMGALYALQTLVTIILVRYLFRGQARSGAARS
jgi:O-antigen/teichoic acid export membrane protein